VQKIFSICAMLIGGKYIMCYFNLELDLIIMSGLSMTYHTFVNCGMMCLVFALNFST
jgi:hypothetical protein